jgi:hypothetical protein
MRLDQLFADSFDTFKVFNTLDVQQASLTNNGSPNSVWQILNHLVIWQDYQIDKLQNVDTPDINEVETWFAEKAITDPNVLVDQIVRFERQLETVKSELAQMETGQTDFELKLKIVQDLSVHLSFHLGEIVLLLRQNGHYPMPHEMKSFLGSE